MIGMKHTVEQTEDKDPKTIAKQLRFNEGTIADVLALCKYYKCNFSDAIRFAVREWANLLREREREAQREIGVKETGEPRSNACE